MKRYWVLSLLVVALLSLALVAACGGNETETTTTAATAVTETTAAAVTETTAAVTETTAAVETTTTVGEPITLYVGGTFALTGPYAEDCAAMLAAFQDYVAYVNENHIIAPWYPDKTIPENITFEVMWADDALDPAKTLTIYEDQKSKGLLVQRISGTVEGLALKDLVLQDNIAVTGQTTSAAFLQPPGNLFVFTPTYSDQMAAIAEWFLESWTGTEKPRIAYLTADAALGRAIVHPELQAYLEQLGYEFVGTQFVPLVATAAPTTQLAWLKDNGVDLAVGQMVNPGSQPTIKEAVRLGMGVDQDYEITFGFGNPSSLQIFLPDMGEMAEGVVVAGAFCAEDADVPAVAFINMLKEKYGAGKGKNVMYYHGISEALVQVEALRLASMEVDPAKLTSEDVLKKGFWQIKDFDNGGLDVTPYTFGEGDVQALDGVRLQQVQNGKIVELGVYPMRNILPAAK